MKIEYSDKQEWNDLSAIDAIKAMTMAVDTRPVLENWNLKYIDARIDMRTGSVLLKEGNCHGEKARYLVIREDENEGED